MQRATVTITYYGAYTMNKLIIFLSMTWLFYASPLYAKEECTDVSPVTERDFSQSFFTREGKVAMYCSRSGCTIYEPYFFGRRDLCIEDYTIYLNYGMKEHEVIKVEIIELTGNHISLKYPDIEEIQTFYRPEI